MNRGGFLRSLWATPAAVVVANTPDEPGVEPETRDVVVEGDYAVIANATINCRALYVSNAGTIKDSVVSCEEIHFGEHGMFSYNYVKWIGAGEGGPLVSAPTAGRLALDA